VAPRRRISLFDTGQDDLGILEEGVMKKLIFALVIVGLASPAYAQNWGRNRANYGATARGSADWGKTMGDPKARQAAGRAEACSNRNVGCAKK